MNKINFDVDIKDFKGEVIGKLNDTIAGVLQHSTTGNAVKLNGWAVKLYMEGVIEIDDADLTVLINFINNNEYLFNVTKAAALEILQDVKKEV